MPKNHFQPPIGFGECRTDIIKETSTVDGRTVTTFKKVIRKRSEVVPPHSSQFPKLKELLNAGIAPEKVSCRLDQMDPQERLAYGQRISQMSYQDIVDILSEETPSPSAPTSAPENTPSSDTQPNN